MIRIDQDFGHGHGVFFLDPHGEAIHQLLEGGEGLLTHFEMTRGQPLVINTTDEVWSFGINLLACRDITSLTERMETYTRAYNVFRRIWADSWGVWLQLIIENTLHVFIENQQYTLAEVPHFLTDIAFRKELLGNVKINRSAVDFWYKEFQPKQAEAALTRIRSLLSHTYIRHIVGQKQTTFDIRSHIEKKDILLIEHSASLPDDIRRFIGAILISELTHALMTRKVRNHYAVFVNEFQHFATSDFARLVLEGRKFAVAITVSHQERFGQFGENADILGATDACANKVLFQWQAGNGEA